MSKKHLYLGATGEEAASSFLKEKGYRILARNYKTRLGEIDIVAKDNDTIVFIEVKARRSNRFGEPYEAVSKFKQRQIAKCALVFLKEKDLWDKKARFDIVSVLYAPDNKPKIDLIKNAFELDAGFTI